MNIIKKNDQMINFYTYYQILDLSKGQQSLISKSIKVLIDNLEKEINNSFRDSSLKFRIHYDIVDNKTANKDHYNDFIKKNNINIVCQTPNYFKCEDWSNYFDNAIYFDSFNMKDIKDQNHKNLFYTPISNNSLQNINQLKKTFRNKDILRILCCDGNVSENDKIVEKFKIESEYSSVNYKVINNWKKNNFQNLKKNISCLEKNQVLFLDKNSFSSKATLKNRSDFIKTFIQTESSGELCGVGIDIRLLTDCFNEVKEVFNFKIFNYVGDDLVEKLQLQDKILSVNPNIPNNIKQYLNWYFQLILDKVLLIAYLYENENFSFVSNKEFLGETVRRLSMLDGKEDLFLGMGEIYYFKNNRKPLVSNYLVSIKSSASKVLKVSLYERQLSTISGLQKVTRVNYPYFDIIKIDNILISEGTFDADFYFEITTPFYEGINILLFDNVLDEKFEYKQLIKKEHQNGYFYFRYRVSATFTFFSRPENYPFDKQVIFISYSLTNVEKFGMLQLIKVEDINKNFISNGWNILGFRSGIIRKKEDYRPVFEDRYKIISEQNRIAIIMERPSSFTIIKILVPLSFLACLTIYAMYLPIEELETIIASITTSFLSAIALYFSVEKPSPLKLTIIDLIFLLFYVFVGISFLAIFSLWFFPEFYTQGLGYVRRFLLCFSSASIYYIYNKIKSFKPKIIFD